MDTLRLAFDSYGPALWVALAIVVLGIALWTLVVHRRAARTEARLNALFGDLSGQNTAQMLVQYLNTVQSTAAAVHQMRAEHDELVRLMPSVIRHVGLVRFSPFHDTGGDQSFALALLDGMGNGVVVTGLHSRNDSRLYCKPIERRSSTYSLTPEEREAMDRALGRQVMPARS